MKKALRIDKNVISPEWPIRDTLIGWLIADKADATWAYVAIAQVVVFLWIITAYQVYTTETIGIGDDCP